MFKRTAAILFVASLLNSAGAFAEQPDPAREAAEREAVERRQAAERGERAARELERMKRDEAEAEARLRRQNAEDAANRGR